MKLGRGLEAGDWGSRLLRCLVLQVVRVLIIAEVVVDNARVDQTCRVGCRLKPKTMFKLGMKCSSFCLLLEEGGALCRSPLSSLGGTGLRQEHRDCLRLAMWLFGTLVTTFV